MLGIIIGIASVIMIVSIGGGVRNAVSEELKNIGIARITIYSNSEVEGNDVRFTMDDFSLVKEKVANVKGTKTKSILLQFLAEAGIITLIGGLAGIAFGVLGAYMVCATMGFSAQIHVSTVVIATLFSSGVGIFFGIYPARKAAKMSPIEALRYQ